MPARSPAASSSTSAAASAAGPPASRPPTSTPANSTSPRTRTARWTSFTWGSSARGGFDRPPRAHGQGLLLQWLVGWRYDPSTAREITYENADRNCATPRRLSPGAGAGADLLRGRARQPDRRRVRCRYRLREHQHRRVRLAAELDGRAALRPGRQLLADPEPPAAAPGRRLWRHPRAGQL